MLALRFECLRLVLCALVSLVVVLGCGGSQSSPVPLRIAIDLWPGYYPAVLVAERDALTQDSIDLTVVTPENTDRMMADFISGRYDGVCLALGDAIDLAASEPDVFLVLISDESAGGDAIVGAQALDAAALPPGSKIGTNLGGFGEVFIDAFIREHGLAGKVDLVQVDAAQVPAMLASGQLMAGHTWQPYVDQALQDGAHQWFDSSQTPGLIPDGLVVRGDLIRNSPEALQALVSAWFRQAAWWQANQAAGSAIIAEYLAIDPASISLDGIQIFDAAENKKRMLDRSGPEGLPAVIERYSDFFVKRGVIARPVEPRKLTDPRFVLAVE